MSSETEFSIGDLAVLMITISDNTASQMLFEVVGHDRLEATIERLGMTGTRIPLSPQDMVLGIVGLDSTMGPAVFDLSLERFLHRRYDFDHRAYSPDGNVSRRPTCAACSSGSTATRHSPRRAPRPSWTFTGTSSSAP